MLMKAEQDLAMTKQRGELNVKEIEIEIQQKEAEALKNVREEELKNELHLKKIKLEHDIDKSKNDFKL
jgi:hypothetical protein